MAKNGTEGQMTIDYWNKTYNHTGLPYRDIYVWRNNFFANIVKNNNIKSVLELGCSIGGVLEIICEQNNNVTVCGVDFCKKAIDHANNNFKYKDRAKFILGDLSHQDTYKQFQNKEFDLVFSCGALLYLPPEKNFMVISNTRRIANKFVAHIEKQGDDSPHRKSPPPAVWNTNFIKKYRKMGSLAGGIDLRLLLPKLKVGDADHFIWSNLNDDVMILGI